jgi:DNA-binding XRE family transcriptional regulator
MSRQLPGGRPITAIVAELVDTLAREASGIPDIGTAPTEAEINRAIGARVRMRRRFLNLSQRDVGERIGVTHQQMQKFETGVNRFRAAQLVQIAAALGTTVAELVGEDVA